LLLKAHRELRDYPLDDWAHLPQNAFDLALKLRQKTEVRYSAKAAQEIVLAVARFLDGQRLDLGDK
jgi:hypothetical protein